MGTDLCSSLDVLGKDLQVSSVVTSAGTSSLQDYITGMSDRELLETDSFGDYPISILVSKVRCLFVYSGLSCIVDCALFRLEVC